MRYLKICFIALIISCNSSVKKAPDMPGTYLMASQTVNAGSTGDEIYRSEATKNLY